jgi:hypothetical protein
MFSVFCSLSQIVKSVTELHWQAEVRCDSEAPGRDLRQMSSDLAWLRRCLNENYSI